MRDLGIPFTVATNPEPSDTLTEWRADYRKRWDAETILLNHDGFSMLQLAEPIQQGRMVAVLFDRPHPLHPVEVDLPAGRGYYSGYFLHIARSLGCPLLPAVVVTTPERGYHFEIHEPIYVESKGSRQETIDHTMKKITDVFAPYLCQYPHLWYQFVPVWEKASLPESSS